MDDSTSSQGRRPWPSRPESLSSSTHTRMTPPSSNGSSANLPRSSQHSGRGAPATGASLLQERLRERKIETAKHSRRRSVDLSTNGERAVQSSPIKPGSNRDERRPSSSGAGKGMGVKQIEDQVSTLHKQNFDLKLELYHRRQRQETLEIRLEVAERQIEEQAELQEVNEQLLAELERRDQAVEEAINLIVTLEEKVERLMKERENVKTFDAEYEPGYFPSHEGPRSSPPQCDSLRPNNSVARMPSFLSEQTESTEALRSLYLPNNYNYSDATLPKLAEDIPDRMDSPRLSVLSESSFVSVYGEKITPPEPEAPKRHRASSSVEKWIEERSANTPTRKSSAPKSQFLSINDVVASPLQKLEKLRHTLEKHTLQHQTVKTKETFNKQFDSHTLPPTPDTIGTDTLRHFKNNDFQNSTFLNSASTFPSNHNLSNLSIRPRSAGETVTSRRDGHGWDTETQEDFTETGSVSSTASTYNGQNFRPKRVMTPDLFSFSNHDSNWSRDVMFNNSRLPSTAHRYGAVRRSSMVEHPKSDDTVMPSSRNSPSVSTSVNTSILFPPDRRSSLSATTKLRKVVPIPSSPASVPQLSPASKEKDTKKQRFTNRLFGRSEAASGQIRPLNGRTQSYMDDSVEEARATPPPIRRNRTSQGIQDSLAVGVRRPGTFALDVEEPEKVDDEKTSAGKKWFGIGRSGSVRRN